MRQQTFPRRWAAPPGRPRALRRLAAPSQLSPRVSLEVRAEDCADVVKLKCKQLSLLAPPWPALWAKRAGRALSSRLSQSFALERGPAARALERRELGRVSLNAFLEARNKVPGLRGARRSCARGHFPCPPPRELAQREPRAERLAAQILTIILLVLKKPLEEGAPGPQAARSGARLCLGSRLGGPAPLGPPAAAAARAGLSKSATPRGKKSVTLSLLSSLPKC